MKSFKLYYEAQMGGTSTITDWYDDNRDRMQNISADYDVTSESDILDDIKDLPTNFTFGLGIVNALQWLVDRESSLMHKQRSDEVELGNDYHGRPVNVLKQDLVMQIMQGLDKYYGQNFTQSALSSTVPGSSKYMNWEEEAAKSVPTEWGMQAGNIFLDMRTDILHHWKEKRSKESQNEPGTDAVRGISPDRPEGYKLD
jgi:hypothetical protein